MKPREKLFAIGVEELSLAELWSVVIGHGTKNMSAFRLAERLVNAYGVARDLRKLDADFIASALGVGRATTARIQAVLELGMRYFSMPGNLEMPVVTCAEQAYNLLQDMANYDREALRGLYLDTRSCLIADQLLSLGSLMSSPVHPREVFKPAIVRSAACLLVAHNHPSGSRLPSDSDFEVTKGLIAAGEVIGIPLIDHVIIARDGFFSFRDETDLDFGFG